MNLTSKFNVNDKCWVKLEYKYYEGVITSIECWDNVNGFTYKLKTNDRVNVIKSENELFASDDKNNIINDMFVSYAEKPF